MFQHQIKLLTAALCGALSLSYAQPTPNSSFFTIQDYYIPEASGDLERYSAKGFFENGVAAVTPRVSILPRITIDTDSVAFFDLNGNKVDPRTSNDIDSISIATIYDAQLPTEAQRTGIAAVLDGTRREIYIPDPAVDSMGRPIVFPAATGNFQMIQVIEKEFAEHKKLIEAQSKIKDSAAKYNFQSLALDDLVVQLIIGGEVADERKMDGSSSAAPTLYVNNPSQKQTNLVNTGNYEIRLKYRFKDSKLRTIDAVINAKESIDFYVKETQKAMTKNRNAGFAVFGIGFRKSKLQQSMSLDVEKKFEHLKTESTVIVMNDADDEMINEFQAAFFPIIADREAIDGHLRAAAEATTSGNSDLAKAHLDYAKALQEQDKFKEVNAIAAAAALASGNYAMFIAEGVRAQVSLDDRTNEFRKVITNKTIIEEKKEWNSARRVSIYRQTSDISRPRSDTKVKPYIGISGFCEWSYPVPSGRNILNPMGWWVPEIIEQKAILVTGVAQYSPAMLAGIKPGMLIRAVNYNNVKTLGNFVSAIERCEVGNRVNFTVESVIPGQVTHIPVVVGRGRLR